MAGTAARAIPGAGAGAGAGAAKATAKKATKTNYNKENNKLILVKKYSIGSSSKQWHFTIF